MSWLGMPISYARHALDILIVAAVVYRILIMMRGTRAAQVLFGLLVILVAFVLSQWLELLALNWLMTHFVDNLFLILVVLFQNEIRRALAQVGRGDFFGSQSIGEMARVVEEVVRACNRMAENRVGALIVVARKTALGNIVDSGMQLDSIVSQPLLETIFHPKTPLHDGAVVIEGARILAAGCVLPLATEGELPREFGTRHRAGLGMSQESDAVVIIISEERGVISLALHGGVVFDLKPEELRSQLQELLRSGGES